MTRFLMRIFLKKHEDPNSPKTRAAYGTLSSCVGIFCNILLFFVKFLMGLLSNSVAVTADAFNNLSDVGSSAISFLGFHMASKPADRDHPFGHGRIEYLSGLIISFLILLVGLDFVKSSVERIFNPSPVTFSWIVIAALVCSILVKLWMSRFNRTLAKEISSAAIARRHSLRRVYLRLGYHYPASGPGAGSRFNRERDAVYALLRRHPGDP